MEGCEPESAWGFLVEAALFEGCWVRVEGSSLSVSFGTIGVLVRKLGSIMIGAFFGVEVG